MNSLNLNGKDIEPSFDRGELTTEEINYKSNDLDSLSTIDIVKLFSDEDLLPQIAVKKAIPEIARSIDKISDRLRDGGRLIYIGAGTSGRLGVLDAAECPPTFCTSPDLVQAIIAGHDKALTRSSEGLEDLENLSIKDLENRMFNSLDCLIGITAGGTTPYVQSALKHSKEIGALTISISCVPSDQVSLVSDIDIRLITGPEILAGSTRLKAGTATKMALNMISTGVMIKLGKVYKNRMIDVSNSNKKLLDRSLRILHDLIGLNREDAMKILNRSNGSVKYALLMHFSGLSYYESVEYLSKHNYNLRKAIDSLNC